MSKEDDTFTSYKRIKQQDDWVGVTPIRMKVRVQRSSCGSGREGLNELNKGVLHLRESGFVI